MSVAESNNIMQTAPIIVSHGTLASIAQPLHVTASVKDRIISEVMRGNSGAGAPLLKSPASHPLLARMDSLERTGKCESFDALFPSGLIVGTERMAGCLYNGGSEGDLLLILISFTRSGKHVVESVVNGRTVYMTTSHSRRVLVTADGRAYPEIDGAINTFVKKYVLAANEVLAARARKGIN